MSMYEEEKAKRLAELSEDERRFVTVNNTNQEKLKVHQQILLELMAQVALLKTELVALKKNTKTTPVRKKHN